MLIRLQPFAERPAYHGQFQGSKKPCIKSRLNPEARVHFARRVVRCLAAMASEISPWLRAWVVRSLSIVVDHFGLKLGGSDSQNSMLLVLGLTPGFWIQIKTSGQQHEHGGFQCSLCP